MRLRYLEVDNFLGHEHEELLLPAEGLFLLAGESGFGKSSLIVDAVAYALFGHVATRYRKQADLRHRDHPGSAMSVRAMFEFEDASQLIIARGLDERDSSWARAYEPDPNDPSRSQLLAEGVQPVARLIRRRMGGMSWQQFYAAFVARQSEISKLTELRGRERKELVHRMLGMRELEKSAELITAGRSRTRAELEQLQRSIGDQSLAERRQELIDAEAELADRAERSAKTTASAAALREQCAELEARLAPLREAQRSAHKRAELDSRVTVLAERLSRHERAQAVIAGAEAARREQSEAADERETLGELYTRSDEHRKLSERRAAVSERTSELRATILSRLPVPVAVGGGAEPQIDPAELRAESQRLGVEIERGAERLGELEEQLRRLRDTGECYACLRPFDGESEHHHVVETLEQAIAELTAAQTERDERQQALRACEGELSELEESQREAIELERRLRELLEAGEIAGDLEDVIARGREAKQRYEQGSQKLAEVAAAEQDLSPTAAAELEEARGELAGLGAGELNSAELERLETEHGALSRELASLEGRLPELARAISDAERRCEQLRTGLEGFEHELAGLERLRAKSLAYENLQTLLRGYQRHLAAEIRPALEEIGSEMLFRISSGRHRALRISDDYEIEVETAEGFTLPASGLSGGESIRANICLRLALTRLVSQRTGVPVGFLILDEPLPSQDPGHIERIMELLESLRPFYRQQFIISHVGNLRNADQIDHVLDFHGAVGRERVELVSA